MMSIVTPEADFVRADWGKSWQSAMKAAVRDPRRLCQMLDLPQRCLPGAERAAKLFPVFAPLSYLAQIRKGDPSDPLLRQILPIEEEFAEQEGYSDDPLDEQSSALTPGLLQKYHGRALLITTGACAVHCRYCFRRHYPYADSPKSPAAWNDALDIIAGDPTIEEVLLSGGDPLTLVDRQLSDLADRLSQIQHLRRLRLHTRLPIMIPQRVTDELIDWLCRGRLTPIVVVHANHPRELSAAVLSSLKRLIDGGAAVLNQAVLLRGVNDDADTLSSLCSILVDHRVMPYYLHQLDPVNGAAHFEVPVPEGMKIMNELRSRLPGYAVPRYVQEIPGEKHKSPLTNDCLPL